jgi:hypothetical protein
MWAKLSSPILERESTSLAETANSHKISLALSIHVEVCRYLPLNTLPPLDA